MENAGKEKPAVAVDVIVACMKDFSSIVEVNGTVLSYEMVELHPEISGRITYLNIVDGAEVKEGTLLVRINDADLQAQLEQQKNQLDLAQKTEKRYRELLAVNGVNQSDYDVAVSQVNNYKALVNVLIAQIDKTVIKAPFSGKLGLRMVSPGAYVTPLTVISTLQETDRVKIDFTMPEVYAGLIKTGDTVMLQANSSGQPQKARVIALEPQINTSTRNFKGRALLLKGILSSGSFVKVILAKKNKGIVVPTNCIIPDAMSNMVILVKDGKAVFQNVETGDRTADQVELTKGVNPGDSVVVSGILFVRPNAKLKVKKARKST